MHMRKHHQMKSVLAGLLWLLAMLWPNVQAFAAQNEDLSWLLCSPKGQFDLSSSEIQTYRELGLLDESGPQKGGHSKTCPFQGCLGSAHAGLDLPATIAVPLPTQRLAPVADVRRTDANIADHGFSPRNPRAPPAFLS